MVSEVITPAFSISAKRFNNLVCSSNELSNFPQKELKKIEHSEFVGIGTISDDQNRYTKTPHSSYEFKIPTDLVGRSDNYGIFVSVYDYESNSVYSWPIGIQSDVEKIPSPSTWGNLVSPDKSLPEFDIPLLIIISSLLGVTLFSRKISFPKVI